MIHLVNALLEYFNAFVMKRKQGIVLKVSCALFLKGNAC